MIEPRRDWTTFNTEEEKIEKLKIWKLIPPKAKELKTLYYKGAYTTESVECDVVGYVDDNEIVVYIDGKLHSIHPDYLSDMQNKKFSREMGKSEVE